MELGFGDACSKEERVSVPKEGEAARLGLGEAFPLQTLEVRVCVPKNYTHYRSHMQGLLLVLFHTLLAASRHPSLSVACSEHWHWTSGCVVVLAAGPAAALRKTLHLNPTVKNEIPEAFETLTRFVKEAEPWRLFGSGLTRQPKPKRV